MAIRKIQGLLKNKKGGWPEDDQGTESLGEIPKKICEC